MLWPLLVTPAVLAVWWLLRPTQNRRPLRVPATPPDADLAVDWEAATERAPRTGERYLVLGSGFLGCRIIHALLLRGETDVRVADKSRALFDRHFGNDSRVHFVTVDVTKPDDVLGACADRTVVYHTAAIIRYMDRLPQLYALSYNVNVKGVENTVQACLRQGVRKLIFTSSSNVSVGLGVCGLNMTEANPYVTKENTPNHYCITKALGEQLVLQANGRATDAGHPLHTCAIRPTSGVFGCGDAFNIDFWLAGDKAHIDHLFPSMLIDYVYVDNVVLGELLAEAHLPGAAAGEAFCISNNEPITAYNLYAAGRHYDPAVPPPRFAPYNLLWVLAHVLETLQWLFPRRSFNHPELNLLRPAVFKYCSMDYVYTSDKAQRVLGYRPLFTIDTAIQRSLREARNGRRILTSTRQPDFPR